MIEIPLTQGYVAIVDEIDSDLAEKKWHSDFDIGEIVYAKRMISVGKKKQTSEKLHRVILSRVLGRTLLRSEDVDHINRNGLDNRRENLRLATRSQNAGNQKIASNNTSGYKGVSWHKATKKWQARVRVNWKRIYLGLFDTAEEAYEAYCIAAKKYFGEFARFE